MFKVVLRLTGYDTPVTGGNGRTPSRRTPSPPVYLLLSDRDVPIDRFFSSILSLFKAPKGAVFSMQKRTRSVLSELRRTHNMHDWTLSGTDHPAVHFNVEQKGKGSSLCSTFFPSQQFFSFFFSMPLIKVFLIISYVPCFSEVPAFILWEVKCYGKSNR